MGLFQRHRRRGSRSAAPAALAAARAALHHNSTQSQSLFSLPGEVLSVVCSYLTLGESGTLMLVCTRFWNAREGDGVFAPTWRRLRPPQSKPDERGLLVVADSSRLERFRVLRMVEYDGKLLQHCQNKYCCWGCLTIHSQEAFSREEMARGVNLKVGRGTYPNHQDTTTGSTGGRYCLATKSCLCYGIGEEMSFVELKSLIAVYQSDPRARHISFPPPPPNLHCPSYIHLSDSTLRFNFVLARICDLELLGGLPQLMRAINLPLCPHIFLGHKDVTKLYNKVKNKYPDSGYYFPVTHRCKRCKTTVELRKWPEVIQFYIYRPLGRLESPTDPAWLAQVFSSKDPRLDDHCQAFLDWKKSVYSSGVHVQPPLENLKEFKPDVPRPDFDKLFTSVILPKRGRGWRRFW